MSRKNSTLTPAVLDRRALLGAMAGAGLLVACGKDDSASDSGSTSTTAADGTTTSETTTTSAPSNTPPGPPPGASGAGPGGAPGGSGATRTDLSDGECEPTPTETAGPYPGDGSNGPDVLEMDGVVREDITKSLATDVTADGVPLEITLTLVDNANGCAPMANAGVYLWHADGQGRYSMYSDGTTNDTFLRGVQSTDADGKVTFKTIFPGCYDGRWPHMHYEVYASESDATSGGEILLTSQIAFPKAQCETVYADSRYPDSASNLSRVSLETDGIFSDSADVQTATMSGDTSGMTATIEVSV